MYGYEVFCERELESLINDVRNKIVPHSFVFCGQKGLGRLSAARLFAQALCCAEENTPCGVCRVCIGSRAESNPDIRIIKPKDGKKSIGVTDVRDILSDAYIKPFESERKVYIFPEAELLTAEAQNAFLKLLEEPPMYAVFIMICENTESLLPTVLSRCVTVRILPLSSGKMREYIKKKFPDEDRIDFLIKYSDGIPARVDAVVADENFDKLRQGSLKALYALLSPRLLSAYNACKFAEENKEDFAQIIEIWQSFIRDILLMQNGLEKDVVNNDIIDRLRELMIRIDDKTAVIAAEELALAQRMNKRYVSLRSNCLRLAFSIKKRAY